MKTLISQSAFAKLVNGNQGTISKYVNTGKLPAEGKKLIMPDAEKRYHLIMAGMELMRASASKSKVNNQKAMPNLMNLPHDTQLTVPDGKFNTLKYANLSISLNNFEYKSASVSSDDFLAGINLYDDAESIEVMLSDNDDPDINIMLEIVEDAAKDRVMEHQKKLLTDEYFQTFIVTKSELIEFLRSKKA